MEGKWFKFQALCWGAAQAACKKGTIKGGMPNPFTTTYSMKYTVEMGVSDGKTLVQVPYGVALKADICSGDIQWNIRCWRLKDGNSSTRQADAQNASHVRGVWESIFKDSKILEIELKDVKKRDDDVVVVETSAPKRPMEDRPEEDDRPAKRPNLEELKMAVKEAEANAKRAREEAAARRAVFNDAVREERNKHADQLKAIRSKERAIEAQIADMGRDLAKLRDEAKDLEAKIADMDRDEEPPGLSSFEAAGAIMLLAQRA